MDLMMGYFQSSWDWPEIGFIVLIKFSGRINIGIACHGFCWEVVTSCGDSSVDGGGCGLVGFTSDCGCRIISGVEVV